MFLTEVQSTASFILKEVILKFHFTLLRRSTISLGFVHFMVAALREFAVTTQ